MSFSLEDETSGQYWCSTRFFGTGMLWAVQVWSAHYRYDLGSTSANQSILVLHRCFIFQTALRRQFWEASYPVIQLDHLASPGLQLYTEKNFSKQIWTILHLKLNATYLYRSLWNENCAIVNIYFFKWPKFFSLKRAILISTYQKLGVGLRQLWPLQSL